MSEKAKTTPKRDRTFGKEVRYGNGNGYDNDFYRPALQLDLRTMSNVRSNPPNEGYRDGWERTFGKGERREADPGEAAPPSAGSAG